MLECRDQTNVFALLQDPAPYGRIELVIRIDTHGAAVFPTGPDVYKVKRAIRFPSMDFSALEKRQAVCKAENAINRMNVPEFYLGIVPMTRDGGGLRLDDDGKVVERTIHLRRFDENATCDRLAASGPFSAELIDALAQAVNAAHQQAPVRDGDTATNILHRLLGEAVDALAELPIVRQWLAGPYRLDGFLRPDRQVRKILGRPGREQPNYRADSLRRAMGATEPRMMQN